MIPSRRPVLFRTLVVVSLIVVLLLVVLPAHSTFAVSPWLGRLPIKPQMSPEVVASRYNYSDDDENDSGSSRENSNNEDDDDDDGDSSRGGRRTKKKNSPGIQFMITQRMRRVLEDELGYRKDEVDVMEPQIAAVVIERGLSRPSAGMPRSWRRTQSLLPVIGGKAAKAVSRIRKAWRTVYRTTKKLAERLMGEASHIGERMGGIGESTLQIGSKVLPVAIPLVLAVYIAPKVFEAVMGVSMAVLGAVRSIQLPSLPQPQPTLQKAEGYHKRRIATNTEAKIKPNVPSKAKVQPTPQPRNEPRPVDVKKTKPVVVKKNTEPFKAQPIPKAPKLHQKEKAIKPSTRSQEKVDHGRVDMKSLHKVISTRSPWESIFGPR